MHFLVALVHSARQAGLGTIQRQTPTQKQLCESSLVVDIGVLRHAISKLQIFVWINLPNFWQTFEYLNKLLGQSIGPWVIR